MESVERLMNLSFYKDRVCLITGHTGFKGSWMCLALSQLGARVIGYSLEPPTKPSMFDLANVKDCLCASIVGDIRDFNGLKTTFDKYEPEVVIHLAAQPIVRDSYKNPVYTYETNVLGTVNVLEAVRLCDSVKSVINVTTDKVYQNNEWPWGYRETDVLNGHDPYSNSKSCSELITSSYKKSFLQTVAISRLRSGNVIGGGDFAEDRIIPDCIRAMKNNREILVRNRWSTRPYQHVLEPVCFYLQVAKMQYENRVKYEGVYNIGPDDCDYITTGELVDLFCEKWSPYATWKDMTDANSPHEAGFLKLDCSKSKTVFGFKPRWHIAEAVEKTVDWSRVYISGGDVKAVSLAQLYEFLGE